MPLNRRRALGLLTVVLAACASGDNSTGKSTLTGFGSGASDTTTGPTGTATDATDGTSTDSGTGGGTDTYGTDGGGGALGDGGYFGHGGSVKDVDLGG